MKLARRFNPANWLLLVPALICFLAIPYADFLRLQVALLGAVLAAVWLARHKLTWNANPPQRCAPLRCWSRNPLFCDWFPAFLSVALRLLLLPWEPAPHPVVPDEYSHLFLAKTFLAGRLANPPHPLWRYFETIHILSQPTYSSMYVAGQACFLAAGKLLMGSFFAGVVLSTALFCAALTWFLRAVLPPGWALFGGCLAAVRFGAASYWNDSYWGGSVGALGGALVLGAFVRLRREWKMAPALAFAVGAVLLANTRPYEGFGLAATLLAALAWSIFKQRARMPWRRLACSVAAAAIVMTTAGWAMTRQWKAVTGSALTLPYQVNERTYGWPLTLPFTPVRQVSYRHREMALYRDFELREHELITQPSKIPIGVLEKTGFLWLFFVGPGLTAVLFFTDRILRTPRFRVLWAAGLVVGLQVVTEQSGYPHYLSPAAPIVVLFLIRGLQHLAHARPRGIPFGPALVRLALPMMLAVIAVRAAVLSPGRPPSEKTLYYSWCCGDTRVHDRDPLVQKLLAEPGQQLVLVVYDLDHYDTAEWVYNDPDIDHAKIVFARDMGPEQNQALLSYFAGRRVWRVHVAGAKAYLLTEVQPTPALALTPKH
jgi:hypothetical protein